jgi:hypothetical protein
MQRWIERVVEEHQWEIIKRVHQHWDRDGEHEVLYFSPLHPRAASIAPRELIKRDEIPHNNTVRTMIRHCGDGAHQGNIEAALHHIQNVFECGEPHRGGGAINDAIHRLVKMGTPGAIKKQHAKLRQVFRERRLKQGLGDGRKLRVGLHFNKGRHPLGDHNNRWNDGDAETERRPNNAGRFGKAIIFPKPSHQQQGRQHRGTDGNNEIGHA